MPININDQDYVQAERDYYNADTLEEKLACLKRMISHMPGHKGAENLRAQLRLRAKKLEQDIVRKKKTGKSTLINLMTNASPKITELKFSTTEPIIGMLNVASIDIQLIENPAPESDFYDKGLTNSADTILFIINSLEEIEPLKKLLDKATNKIIILYNDKKNLSSNELRKLNATMKSKKMNFIITNLDDPLKDEIEKLKEKFIQTFDKIRIYTKEPGKEKSSKPVILKQNSTVKDVAEKILKGFSTKIKQTKIWGPSSKFAGQIVGLNHKLKDLDVVEFRTK